MSINMMVFSVKTEDQTKKELDLQLTQMRIMLRELKLDYVESLGSYKGVQEPVFIVSDYNESVFFHLITTFNQECILLVANDGICQLKYSNGCENIGSIKWLNPSEVGSLYKQEAWTYHPKACSFFIVE